MGKRDVYDCLYTSQPIKVDGLLNEPAWEKARVLNFIEPVTNKKTLSKTDAKLLWDDRCLYVGFKAYDKDINSFFCLTDVRSLKSYSYCNCLEYSHPLKLLLCILSSYYNCWFYDSKFKRARN